MLQSVSLDVDFFELPEEKFLLSSGLLFVRVVGLEPWVGLLVYTGVHFELFAELTPMTLFVHLLLHQIRIVLCFKLVIVCHY